jgi:hypothetical protein
VNIHTRLVGAIDAVVLSLSAAMTIAMLVGLFSPSADRHVHYSVTIEQLSQETSFSQSLPRSPNTRK